MSSSVTVLVPAHGLPDRLRALLRALDAQVPEGGLLRVLVSDDASPEPLEPLLRSDHLERLALEVVRSDVNGGPGAARNRALARVETAWVACIDADELPGEGWLEKLVALVEAPEAPDGFEGSVWMGAVRASPFAHATEPSGEGGEHVAGNVVFRTEVLRGIGGFDERFYDARRRIHFREDADLFFRFDRGGYRIERAPELVVEHPPLPSSLLGPARLARRYYFDPLLSREHTEAFRRLNAVRRVGPVSLRRARHDAALLFAGGALCTAAALVARRRRVAAAGGVALLGGWAANAAALSRGRRVERRHVVPLVGVSALVPWVYLWHYYRGVITFRHRPRL